jgi:hypothetical protein
MTDLPEPSFAPQVVSGPTQQCRPDQGGCGLIYPLTEQFWHVHSEGQFRTDLCKKCRNAKEQLAQRTRQVDEIKAVDEAILPILASTAATGGSNLPHARAVYEMVMRKLGGVEGFSSLVASQILASPPGSPTRGKGLADVLRLSMKLSETNQIEDDVERMTDEELMKRVQNTLQECAQRVNYRKSHHASPVAAIGRNGPQGV